MIDDIKNLDPKDSRDNVPPNSEDGQKPMPSLDDLQKEFQELVRKKFGSGVHVIAVDNPPPVSPGPDKSEKTKKQIRDFKLTPKDIVEHLNTLVIGQENAKKSLAIAVADHYRHIQAEADGDVSPHFQKQNVLLLGPTGVGKTFLVRSIAKLIGVPFVKADATRFTEVGYVGANVDDVIRDLVQQADGDISLAENGIVYVDEIDKIASSPGMMGKDVSGRGVQFGFLKLLEDTEVDLNNGGDIASQFKNMMSLQKKGKVSKEMISTKNILFIFSGAFPEMNSIIKKRVSNAGIGFHSTPESKSDERDKDYLSLVKTEDLVKFGFEQEFIGRLPVVTSCHPLTEDNLFEILKNSEASIINQYVRNFDHYGVNLSFSDEGLREIAKMAYEQKTGARALVKVCDQVLRDFKYELPRPEITDLTITPEVVFNPQGLLQYLVSQPAKH